MKIYPKLVHRDLSFILSNQPLTMGQESLNFTIKESSCTAQYKHDDPGYETAMGWHFYSHLVLSRKLLESESNEDAHRVAKLYETYTRAARQAINVIGDGKIAILEHQGVLLHFFLEYGSRDTASLIEFAKDLAASVRVNVFHGNYDGVERFKMAAEFGKSIIVKMPSASGQKSTFSRISIGPSANDPAKKLLGGDESSSPQAWHLAYRASDAKQANWSDADCSPPQVAIEMLKEAAEYKNFSLVEQIDMDDDKTADQLEQYTGFVFRADLNNFTEKVREAFDRKDDLKALDMAQSLVDFISDYNDWQANNIVFSGHKVKPFPWTGDCGNMVIYPIDANGQKISTLSKDEYNELPQSTIISWEKFLASTNKRDGFGEWSFGMAAGNINVFYVEANGEQFRLMTGWPVGVSQEGVNLDGTGVGDLVMHNEDIEVMDDYMGRSFRHFVDKNGNVRYRDYKKQTKAERNKAARESAAVAASSRYSFGYHVPSSKPHSTILMQ